MKRYDPSVAPDPHQWLALDEQERTDLVMKAHHAPGVPLDRAILHATFHAVVETQIAMSDATVQGTLDRLMREGLDRHDAVHAIASVLAECMWDAVREPKPGEPPVEAYYRDLKVLKVSVWLKTGSSAALLAGSDLMSPMVKPLKPGQKLSVTFTQAEIDLVRDHTMADPEYMNRLKPVRGEKGVFRAGFTLGDLDDLLGYIAAEANHSRSKKRAALLYNLYDRLQAIVDAHEEAEA